MGCSWSAASDRCTLSGMVFEILVVFSIVEVCVDYGGVYVFYVCVGLCVSYGVWICVNVCGIVCVVHLTGNGVYTSGIW